MEPAERGQGDAPPSEWAPGNQDGTAAPPAEPGAPSQSGPDFATRPAWGRRRRRHRGRGSWRPYQEGAPVGAPPGAPPGGPPAVPGVPGEAPASFQPRYDRPRPAPRPFRPIEAQTATGLLEFTNDGAGYLRSDWLTPSPVDPYVHRGLMRRFGLREADRVEGLVRRGQGGRNEVFQILKVNRDDPELAAQRPDYESLKAIYPDKMFKLEMGPEPIANRVIDLMCPLGMGQRALIVAPPKAGKTILLTQIAKGLAHNHPDVPVVALLVGERPEEVTEIERSLHGVVFSSTFDEDPRSHIRVAEIGIEYAKRQVELGQNVVVLLDSITRLARAYNLAIVSSDRTLSGGIDSAALFPPKKFFGAARNVENGGSLTTIGTALVETGSRMDDVIFEEFKGTGNMELRLSRELADRRVFPAIDVLRSGTRREEMLLEPEALRASVAMRRALERSGPSAMESFLKKLGEAQSNADFVRAVLKAGLG